MQFSSTRTAGRKRRTAGCYCTDKQPNERKASDDAESRKNRSLTALTLINDFTFIYIKQWKWRHTVHRIRRKRRRISLNNVKLYRYKKAKKLKLTMMTWCNSWRWATNKPVIKHWWHFLLSTLNYTLLKNLKCISIFFLGS